MQNQACARITERITTLLEQGTVPWHKPWKSKAAWPRNFVSQKSYRGVNVFLLSTMNYESPCWLTFRQASQLGASIRKGEKACPVVFWKKLSLEDAESGKDKTIPMLRVYHVFNTAQCEGLPAAPTGPAEFVALKPAAVVAGMPHPPAIKHGMTWAYYSPLNDCVAMPSREQFDAEENYFATLFHELIHATGHWACFEKKDSKIGIFG